MRTLFQYTDRHAGTTVYLDEVEETPNPGPAIQVGIGDRTGPDMHARLTADAARDMALTILAKVGWPEPGDSPAWLADLDATIAEAQNIAGDAHPDHESAFMPLIRAVETMRERIGFVEHFCRNFTPVPPPIYRGPGLSERGEGYNHGTRDMATGVLAYLAGPSDEDCE